MSSFEINKIMGAIFSVTLLILVINNITTALYNEEDTPIEIKTNSIEKNLIQKNVEQIVEINIEERLVNADINQGLKIIKKCIACHTFTKDGKNKLGPNLYNITSRKIASIQGFKYSNSLDEKNDIWSNENLDKFLTNPKKWAPGTKMIFIGIKNPQDRANLIKYLQSIK
tara:strand:+ start:16218 stop:16727 length:510 start_codon:yes stop_codon:yes gene_type:complete